jgi:hypothetical protein
VSGAGCPRVTHPFAALPSEGLPLPRFPLDLHVLGTPPAFVLSQDQTLRREPSFGAHLFGWGRLWVRCESRLRRVALPARPPVDPLLFPYDRQSQDARKTSVLPSTGNALAFGTLFSSQGARGDSWSHEKESRRPISLRAVAPCVNRPPNLGCGRRLSTSSRSALKQCYQRRLVSGCGLTKSRPPWRNAASPPATRIPRARRGRPPRAGRRRRRESQDP